MGVRESGMRMRTSWTPAGSAIIAALLALAPRTAAAQFNPFDRSDAPPHVQNFTGGTVRELEHDFQADLYVMGAFSGKKRIDRFEPAHVERPQPWKFYGRLGPMHFFNQLESPRSQGFQFSFRRQGPNLGGRIYIGIHKTFD
jgi:hypothetical protein